MTTPTTTTDRPRRAAGDKPSPHPHRRAGRVSSETRATRADATLAPGSGDTSTPATSAQDVQDAPTGNEPRGIEPARLVAILTRATIAGGVLLIGAAGALGTIPPHRWPQVGMALAYAAAAGMSLLIGAGLSWAALTRESPTDK